MSVTGAEMPRKSPATVAYRLYHVDYVLDLDACREALAGRAIELRAKNPKATGMDLVAQRSGVSRKTLSRFLAGEQVNAQSLTDIITRGLGLNSSDVLRRVTGGVTAPVEAVVGDAGPEAVRPIPA